MNEFIKKKNIFIKLISANSSKYSEVARTTLRGGGAIRPLSQSLLH